VSSSFNMLVNRILFFSFFLLSFTLLAQPEKNLTNKDKYDYMFGASWLTSGYVFNKNYVGPFQNSGTSGRIFFDRHLYEPWSIEGALVFESSTLYPIKETDTTYRFDSLMRFNLDISSKYSFGKSIGSGLIDPFILMGGGINLHKSIGLTANIGVGLNLWVSNNFGLQAQTLLKLPASKNVINLAYLQTNFGVVVRFSKPQIPSDDFAKKRYKISKKRKRIKIRKDKES
jgi:hypothetical protein